MPVFAVSGIASQNAMQNYALAKQEALCIARKCDAIFVCDKHETIADYDACQ